MELVQIPPYVSTRFFQESAILLDSRTNVYYTLNDSAASFWKLLSEFKPVEEAVALIANLYDYPPEILRQDMKNLLISLAELGLIKLL